MLMVKVPPRLAELLDAVVIFDGRSVLRLFHVSLSIRERLIIELEAQGESVEEWALPEQEK